MAEILPRHYLIGVIMFVFFTMGVIEIINLFNNASPDFMDTQDTKDYDIFNRTFNKMTDINDSITGIETGVIESQVDEGVFGVLGSLINSAWNTLKLFTQTFSFMNSAFGGLSEILGVPSWVGTILTLLVIVTIIFAIWSAIFQTQV